MKKRKKLLLQKSMGVLLAFSVIVSLALPLRASAAADNTNMFVGKINGEDVVGYLDTTYVYYLSGKDYNASFVTFDENGTPKYELYIRINKDVPTGTYSDSGKYDKDKVYIAVYPEFNKSTNKFGGSYTFRNSEKGWTVGLNSAEYSDNGVFEGTLEGTCMPDKYNSSPTYSEVTVSGSFHFKMQTIHPTMEAYRTGHPEYNEAHKVSFVQSLGTPPSGSGQTGNGSSGSNLSVDHTCRTCGGTGSCTKCYGSGAIVNSYNNKVQTCVRCSGSGKCAVCSGTGAVY